jgi:hypothetical protein
MEHGIGARDETHAGVPGAPHLVVYDGLDLDYEAYASGGTEAGREADELKRSPEADSRTLRHAQALTSLPSTSTAPPGALNCLDIGSK